MAIALSDRVVEYADCISDEELKKLPNEYRGYVTKQSLRILENVGNIFISITTLSKLWSGVIEPVTLSLMSHSFSFLYLKQFYSEQKNDWY